MISVITFEFHLDYTKPINKFAYANGDCGYEKLSPNSERKQEYMDARSAETTVDLWLSLKSKLTDSRTLFVPKQSTSGEPSWKDKGSFPIDKRTGDTIKSKTKTYRALQAKNCEIVLQ